jgi:hypothetical protein
MFVIAIITCHHGLDSSVSNMTVDCFQYQECRQTLRKDSSSRRPVRRPYEYNLSQEDLHSAKRMKTVSKSVCVKLIWFYVEIFNSKPSIDFSVHIQSALKAHTCG